MVEVVVGARAAVVVVAGAGTVVVVVSGVDVEVVVALVVVVTTEVVVARVVTEPAVEAGMEDAAGAGFSGAVIVVGEVIELLEAGGSARVGLSSDPVRHAPRSSGTNTTDAAGFFAICPERRTVRELSHRVVREVPR